MNIKRLSKSVLILLPFFTISLFPKQVNAATLTNNDSNSLANIATELSTSSDIGTIAQNLLIDSITKNLEPLVNTVLSTLSNWLTVDLTTTPLDKSHFATINNAYLIVGCIDGSCQKKETRGTTTDIFFNDTVTKTSSNGGLAEIQVQLQDTIFTNPFCVGPVTNKDDLTCKNNVKAPSKDGDIFVRDTHAAIYGLIYDGEDDGTLQIYDAEDNDKIYKTPESSALIGLLAVGGLGIASKLKKKSS